MFVVGADDNEVNEYTLNPGFDVSTASYSQRLSVAAQDTEPSGIAFNADGTKMFVTGMNDGDINEYTLSTGFDISTASFVDAFGHGTIEKPRGVGFNTDGTKMFIVDPTDDEVLEYALTTGFDVSTASYSQKVSTNSPERSPRSIAFNTNGTKMFIPGDRGNAVREYTLTTGFDVSTASLDGSFSIADEEKSPSGIAFNLSLDGGDSSNARVKIGLDVGLKNNWFLHATHELEQITDSEYANTIRLNATLTF